MFNCASSLECRLENGFLLCVPDALRNIRNNKVSIEIADSACEDLIIRTGVSPNGDGNNDTWIIEGIAQYPANEVHLFDKWGDEIYTKKGYQNEWYGTGKNGLVPDGTYYYLVKLNSKNTAIKNAYTGALLLKR